MSVDINKFENIIADDVFSRLNQYSIIDKYQAFEFLDAQCKSISTDLEIIQTEGMKSLAQVDPRLVLKKKNGEEHEEQDGWIGHILPFDLVQSSLFESESDELSNLKHKRESVLNEMSEVMENLSEDDKDSMKSLLNEECDAFVPKEVSASAKKLLKEKARYSEDSIESIIIRVDKLIESEKQLKKEIKECEAKLEEETKKTIESLTQEKAIGLLKNKWAVPLVKKMLTLSSQIVRIFVDKATHLASKYQMTLVDISTELNEKERELSSLIDDLKGNELDMKGLKEFQKLLRGDDDERN